MKIAEVVISDTATILNCSYSGKSGSWLQWASTTVLSDEQSRTYPLKKHNNFVSNERMYVPLSGTIDFQLIFAPLPKGTKIFDLIEGTGKNMFRLYGIHNENSIEIPVAKECIDSLEIDCFNLKTAVVRGRITDYSRTKKYGIVLFNFCTVENPDCNTAFCTSISRDGTFEADLSLDHSLWGSISTGGNRPKIPFYVRPGDTLDIAIDGLDSDALYLEYTSTNPKGCYERMLKHDVPVIYSDWEKNSNSFAMSDSAFFDMTRSCLDANQMLCDYMAWKHNFSPWECHLLKNRYKFSVVTNHLVLANNIYWNRGFLQEDKMDVQHVKNFFSLYDILNEIPLNDVSLSYLPYFPNLFGLITSIIPISLSERCAGDDYATKIRNINESQILTFKDIMGERELPWVIQCFFMNKVNSLPNTLPGEERENILMDISSLLTDSYLKNKMCMLDSIRRSNNVFAYKLPENNIMSYILSDYKRQFVHVVCFSSANSDSRFYLSPNVENVLMDFNDNSDLQVVFIFNGEEYSKEQFENIISLLPEGSHCIRLNFEDYVELQRLFCFAESQKQISFNRDGWVLRRPLDMNNESSFRQVFRNMIKKERNKM